MEYNHTDNLKKLYQIHRLSELIGFKIPIDGLATAVFGTPVIDIIALDKRLMEIYDYKGTMMSFILNEFGKEAKEIIDRNYDEVDRSTDKEVAA